MSGLELIAKIVLQVEQNVTNISDSSHRLPIDICSQNSKYTGYNS